MKLQTLQILSVVWQVHIQAFIRKLSGSRSVAPGAHIQAFGQKLAHVLDSLVRVAYSLNKEKECGDVS